MVLEESSNFCSYESIIITTEVVLAGDFEQAFNALEPDNSFAFFDLGLTTEEKAMFDQLDIKAEKHYEHGLKSSFSPSYIKYLEDIGNDEVLSSSISSILERIVQSTKNLVSKYPLIFSYATTPEFLNLPLYWHIDQSDNVEVTYRVVIALKGPGTMFCKLAGSGRTDAMNTLNEIRSIFNNNFQDENILAEALVNAPDLCSIKSAIYQAPSYFGAVFIAGGNNLSAIHTAPIINEKRIVFTFGL